MRFFTNLLAFSLVASIATPASSQNLTVKGNLQVDGSFVDSSGKPGWTTVVSMENSYANQTNLLPSNIQTVSGPLQFRKIADIVCFRGALYRSSGFHSSWTKAFTMPAHMIPSTTQHFPVYAQGQTAGVYILGADSSTYPAGEVRVFAAGSATTASLANICFSTAP